MFWRQQAEREQEREENERGRAATLYQVGQVQRGCQGARSGVALPLYQPCALTASFQKARQPQRRTSQLVVKIDDQPTIKRGDRENGARLRHYIHRRKSQTSQREHPPKRKRLKNPRAIHQKRKMLANSNDIFMQCSRGIVIGLRHIINGICKWGFKMDEVLLKLLGDFIFAAVLLVLYRESLKRQEDQMNFLRELIKLQLGQADKAAGWYQHTISNFTRGAARV
jgi:hypothetical protein